MLNLVRHVIDAAKGKHPLRTTRSPHWPAARAKHLELHSVCEVCGGKAKLQVHHISPFHLDPALELDPDNFITLCEAKKFGINCHLLVGHLGNFKSFNKDVARDSDKWNEKLRTRP
jgi:5-methylcytosine-specific restriction protein A